MPDAINHLAAYNRIAKAIEDLAGQLSTQNAALITAIQAMPAPEITFAPVINVGGGGELDCSCMNALVDAISDMNSTINNSICVIAPGMASLTQIQKAIAFIATDGPNLGIDAPPGSFIFPAPGDIDPPPTKTPSPTSPSTPLLDAPTYTGGELGDIAFVDPPGGMAGAADSTAYADYKCKAAYAIILALKSQYDGLAWLAGYEGSLISIGVGGVYEALKFINGIKTGPIIQGVLGPYRNSLLFNIFATFMPEYEAAAWQTHIARTVCGGFSMGAMLVAAIILQVFILGLELAVAATQMKNLLDAHEDELACALVKAKTVEEARTKFLEVVDQYADTLFEKLIGTWGNGQLTILNYLMSDELLTMLFACPAGLDAATLPALGVCVDCLLCSDCEQTRDIKKSSQANYDSLINKAGLVPYPISYQLGNITTDIICCDAAAAWANGSGRLEVWVNGTKKGETGWGGELVRGEVRVIPSVDATFSGDITLKMYHDGSTIHAARLTLYAASWKVVTAP